MIRNEGAMPAALISLSFIKNSLRVSWNFVLGTGWVAKPIHRSQNESDDRAAWRKHLPAGDMLKVPVNA